MIASAGTRCLLYSWSFLLHILVLLFKMDCNYCLAHIEGLYKWTDVLAHEHRAPLSPEQRWTAGVCSESSSLRTAEKPDMASFAYSSSPVIVAALQSKTNQLTHTHFYANQFRTINNASQIQNSLSALYRPIIFSLVYKSSL